MFVKGLLKGVFELLVKLNPAFDGANWKLGLLFVLLPVGGKDTL